MVLCCHLCDSQFQVHGVFSLFQSINFDEKFLHAHVSVSAIVVDSFPFLKRFSLFLKILDESLILLLIILDIARRSLETSFLSV